MQSQNLEVLGHFLKLILLRNDQPLKRFYSINFTTTNVTTKTSNATLRAFFRIEIRTKIGAPRIFRFVPAAGGRG
jgi:archaellin